MLLCALLMLSMGCETIKKMGGEIGGSVNLTTGEVKVKALGGSLSLDLEDLLGDGDKDEKSDDSEGTSN